MGLEIKILDLGDIELEASFLVLAHGCGTKAKAPTFGYLILGGEEPVLVDTGFRDPEIMMNLGMTATLTGEQGLDRQLARHGLEKRDVRWIVHTHLHIDHAGKDHEFPLDTTTVIVNRRELEYSVSGIMGEQYPADYIKHLVDRLHTPGALRLLDLELSGPDEIIPGVTCEPAGGHTEGAMNVLVETDEGIACICGDIIYDINNQVVTPFHQVLLYEAQTTGNQGTSKRQEKAAIRKALNSGRFILPMHDRPALVERTRIVGRLLEGVPGPVIPVEDYPGPTTAEIEAWQPQRAAAIKEPLPA
jgi:glyoxylase-like metal-dependent hydrolase (beta-lactamase superfamily II)